MKGPIGILDLIGEIDRLAQRDNYEAAFDVALDVAIEHERDYFLLELVETIETDATMNVPDDDTASARDHLKYALWLQRFDANHHIANILYHFDRAYIKGSKLALYFYLQIRDEDGPEGDMDPDEFVFFLADKGCAQVYPQAFRMYKKLGLYHRAVEFCDKADDAGFNMDVDRARLIQKHPDECCPWGKWQPRIRVHAWVTNEVHSEICTWLLVAKRRGLSSFPTLLICKYICTKDTVIYK